MLRAAVGSRLSFFLLRRSFFAHALTRTNEVASDEYSGSWLNLLPAFTAARATIGLGKSYPVTAAQLLPNLHGISRADPLIKLAKNCRQK